MRRVAKAWVQLAACARRKTTMERADDAEAECARLRATAAALEDEIAVLEDRIARAAEERERIEQLAQDTLAADADTPKHARGADDFLCDPRRLPRVAKSRRSGSLENNVALIQAGARAAVGSFNMAFLAGRVVGVPEYGTLGPAKVPLLQFTLEQSGFRIVGPEGGPRPFINRFTVQCRAPYDDRIVQSGDRLVVAGHLHTHAVFQIDTSQWQQNPVIDVGPEGFLGALTQPPSTTTP